MYDQHFGLTGRPFQLTPDPAFWYETATHRRAMAYLGYGLAQGEGFIVITGDIGAGKTTLVGHLLDTLDREALNPVHLVSTAIEAADLLRIVAGQLGVDPASLEKAQLLTAIERGLHAVARTGRRTLLIVDEAQALATSALEELRMLSNFQAGGHALLQIVLLGQPEFRAALHGSERLEQLRQRVIAIHHLDPMGAGEVAAYVRHRLSVVGWDARPQFADSAFAALHRLTDGVPRRLNQLANRVMLHAAIEDIDLITAATVETVAADLMADLPTLGTPVVSEAIVEEPGLAAEDGVVEGHAFEEREAIEEEPAPGPGIMAAAGEDHAVEEPKATEDEPEAESVPAVVAAADQHHADDVETAEPERAIEPVAAIARPEPIGETRPSAADNVVRPFRHSWIDLPLTIDEAAGEHMPTVVHDGVADRIAAIEARIEEQDAALRRVLTLLVDWVESGESPKAIEAADAATGSGYVPIRGAAAA